jgi:hypothetical protein
MRSVIQVSEGARRISGKGNAEEAQDCQGHHEQNDSILLPHVSSSDLFLKYCFVH